MVTRILVLAMVLAVPLAVTTPAFAQPDWMSDLKTAKPIPGYPGFEITDKGWIIQGDLAWGKCPTLLQETDEHTGDPDQVKAARACEKAGFSEKGSEVLVATVMETTMGTGSPVAIPDGGGPAILPLAAALLLGSGILTYAILRRR